MKLYVVTQGEYSDYRIVGIYDEEHRDDAEKLVSMFPDGWRSEKAQLEEYELNPYLETIHEGLLLYRVRMSKEGKAKVSQTEPLKDYDIGKVSYGIYDRDNMYVYVYADSEERAIKIANERRLIEIAENRWGGNG